MYYAVFDYLSVQTAAKDIRVHQFAEKRSGKDDLDAYLFSILNDPAGGISTYFAGIQVSLLVVFLLSIPWNLILKLAKIQWGPIWLYGFFVLGAIALIISSYIAPTNRTKYLSNFKRFESMPKVYKRKASLITALIYVGIWTGFILSFVYYLQSITS